MDVVLLSRLQFAAATMFHFLFVPLTLGLSVLIAIMETKWVKTGDETYKRMAKFWGKLFLINFALGVVTGITLEFQFGTNWSRYSIYVGDIFGSLLAIEATAAFFLESTFVAVWVFGWERLSPKLHCLAIWLVAGAGNLSAIWILLANGFMQHPVGFVLRNGRAELESFWPVLFNSFAWQQIFHTLFAAMLLGGFFVMGISAWHLLRNSDREFFQRSFNIGVVTSLIFAVLVAFQGHVHGNEVAAMQPEKLAAMESHWETQKGAPMYLLQLPNVSGPGNMVEALPVPYALSILAYSNPNAEVKGLNDFPEADRPPVMLTFLSFRAMVGLGTLFILIAAFGVWRRRRLQDSPWYLKILPWTIPLPYIAMQTGWIVAEVGRQPWIVYGLMRTSDAVSPISSGQVGVSLAALTLLYALLGVAGFWLMIRYARRGPQPAGA